MYQKKKNAQEVCDERANAPLGDKKKKFVVVAVVLFSGFVGLFVFLLISWFLLELNFSSTRQMCDHRESVNIKYKSKSPEFSALASPWKSLGEL